MIEINGYSKRYGKNTVLIIDKLSLPTNIYWLKGRNGTGKSTFLKSVSGLIPFDGSIAVNESTLKVNPAMVKANVNYSAAEPAFPTFLTGYELLQLFVDAKKGQLVVLNTMLEQLDMLSYIHNQLGSYSSGMLKKLSLVAAFTGRVRWILLDEPFNALDVVSVAIVHQWILERSQEGNIGFILSSHQELPQVELLNVQELQIVNQSISFTNV